MAEDLDVEALLEAPFQKEKPKDSENGKDKKEEDRSTKRFSEEKEDRDSKRRRRSPSPHRDRRERDRDRDRDYRDRDRERERDRDRDYRDRDRDRDYRDRGDRGRERGGGGGGGDRGGYYSSKRRERDRSRDSRRSRSLSPTERDDREFERDKRREREERDRRERELSTVEREAIEAERDSRTVFAINLPIKASERKLYEFFEKAGKVVDIRLISDRNSRKSKGFGYVEYADRESVTKALGISGSTFMGQPIIVQLTQAEKNRVVNTSSTAAAAGPTRLYVGSLHFNISEDDLKSVFAPFGDIDFINLHMDPETGRSKGFGFVQFKRAEDAKRALQQVNGLEIAGRQIKVGLVNETNIVGGAVGALGELDDDDGGGLALNAHSRAMLMAKLQRAPAAIPIAPMAVPIVPVSPFGMPTLNPALTGTPMTPLGMTLNPALAPSPCMLLKNMFDPKTETEPDFHLDIKEDVIEECSKYGTVTHAYVERDSQGFVYLKFTSSDGAQKAISALNHRWFAGKMITAEFIPEPTYYARFPEAKT